MTQVRRLDRWRRLAPALGLALLAAGWVASPAEAQDEAASERLAVRAIDATDPGDVRMVVSWSGDAGDLDGIEVRENGDAVEATVGDLADSGLGSEVVFVFDTSGSTDANALLSTARRAIEPLLDELPTGTQVAVVGAGAASQTLQQLTTDLGLVAEAMDDLTPGGEGALLSGVVRGATMGRAGTVPTIVLVTDGVQDSTTSLDTARGALLAEGATLFVIGLQDGDLDEGALGGLASETGGRQVVATETGQLPGIVEGLTAEVVQLRTVSFESESERGVQDLRLSIGDASTESSYVSGSTLIGARRVAPRPAVEPGGIAFFRSDVGRLIGFGAALVACILFVYGVALLFVRDPTALSQALRPYADSYVASGEDDEGDDNEGLAQTAFLQRAVAITEQLAGRQGFLTRLEHNLEKADLPLRAGEALFFYLAGLLLVLVASLALTQNLMGMIVVGVLVALVPPAVVNYLATRKKKQFEALLPDTLQLLASTLRAGYSMMQGVEAVSQEVSEPMGKELRRVITEARLGRPLEESLDAVAERMGSPDFGWAVMAIRIQREVGGNLSELLLTVAETMTQRERLRRDVNSLTAEGRISAYVLIALPVGLGLFLFTVNRDYIGKLFDVTMGQVMLASAVVMIIVGYVWMMKIIKIEI